MKRYITFIFSAACVLAGCARQLDAPVITDEVIFRTKGLDASFVVDTKATAVTDENLTAFYASATQGTAGSETSVWNSAAFASDGESTPTYYGDKWWPDSDPAYHFYASNAAITFDAAGSTVEASNAMDVVCAYMTDPTYKTLNTLSFEHVFARVGNVNVTADEGYTISGVSITLTPKTGGTFNMRTGAGQTDGTGWSGLTTGSATELFDGASAKTMVYGAASQTLTTGNDLYLVPGTYTVTATWTATRGEYTKTFTGMQTTVNLTGGSINSLSTTLTGTAVELVFGVSVAAWSSNSVNMTFPTE